MEKSGPGGSFPVGRLDTSLRTQRVRQGRRTFFLTLEQVVPTALEDLRSLPETEHEGQILNAADLDLPQFGQGRWLDLRPIALSADVAASLQEQGAETQELGWERLDFELYARFADHLFVPDSVVQWADKWHIGVEWCQAFATLVRTRWRNTPDQPLQEILATLQGFPVVHPFSVIKTLRLRPGDLAGYPTLAPADPRTETQQAFVQRATAHYRDCLDFLKPLSKQRTGIDLDLDRAAEWLVRCQVLGKSRRDIARSANVARQTVDVAVGDLAKLTEIELRPGRPGRPPGSQDSLPGSRHRVTRSRTP